MWYIHPCLYRLILRILSWLKETVNGTPPKLYHVPSINIQSSASFPSGFFIRLFHPVWNNTTGPVRITNRAAVPDHWNFIAVRITISQKICYRQCPISPEFPGLFFQFRGRLSQFLVLFFIQWNLKHLLCSFLGNQSRNTDTKIFQSIFALHQTGNRKTVQPQGMLTRFILFPRRLNIPQRQNLTWIRTWVW